MGCGFSAAADHAVAVASRRVEKDQVVEKAVHRALQAAVAELQDVEISLHVQTPTSRMGNREDASPKRGTPVTAVSPVSPLSPLSVISGDAPHLASRFAAAGLRRGRAADSCGAVSIAEAKAVLVTEDTGAQSLLSDLFPSRIAYLQCWEDCITREFFMDQHLDREAEISSS